MPLEFDITQPVSNQQVGPTVGVLGSFSGYAGNPFTMNCKISNTTYTDTQTGEVDVQAGTWQCTFSKVPVGFYDISAQVATTIGANPAVNVEVVKGQPIKLDHPVHPGPSEASAAGRHGRDTFRLPLRGTTAEGYGLADGYVVYCYLLLAGTQVSSGGRLTAFYRHGHENDWRYELYLPTWAWSNAALLLVELWHVGGEKPSEKPAATVAYPIQTGQ